MEAQKILFSDKKIDLKDAKKVKKQQVFKPYTVNQDFLLPKKISDFVSSNHICVLLNKIIDSMDISKIKNTYVGGGTSAYSPRMLLKVWILGFIYKTYTCRPLAKCLRENMPFIWISGNQTPDFHTLNNFRLRLKDDIKDIFKEVVKFALEAKIISGEDVFIDHSKTEANSNKYKMVWRKQIEKSLANIDNELDELFDHIDKLNEEEDKKFGGKDLPEQHRKGFDEDKVQEVIDKINSRQKEKLISREDAKESRKKVRRTYELIKRKAEYQQKKKIMDGRNSYSKTDTDAVAMMQKDKVSIKPSYNEGICTQNGFVINYVLSQNCNDSVSFIELMNGVEMNLNKTPSSATADATYGTEENHSYLEKKGIKNYLKYNLYHKEKSNAWKNKQIRLADFDYDKNLNTFTCPKGKRLNFVEIKENKTKTGFVQSISTYSTKEGVCKNCRLKKKCLSNKNTTNTRTLQVSWEGERLRSQAKQNLDSDKGKELRSKRANEVESVFGDEKLNKSKRRFVLRSLKKTNIEAGLYYIAHNIRKIKVGIKGTNNEIVKFTEKIFWSRLNIFNESSF